jgi:two-component system sensor histidine kinase KdpD
LNLGEGFVGWVARSGESLIIPDARADERYYGDVDEKTELDLRSILSVPLRLKQDVIGVLQVVDKDVNRFTVTDLTLLESLTAAVATAVENARLAEEAAEIEILHELNRLRSELIANVSHELRTPLGLIKVFCTTLLREDVDFDRETVREFLHDINDETDKLENIVDNLLDLSRLESDRLRLDLQPTDICQLATEIARALETQLERHVLVLDFSTEPLMVTADSKRIEQVLRNLLSNAVKYSPEGGTITIGGRGGENQLLVWVRDSGIGIPSGDLERVFERFYRVQNEVTQNVRGAGLGLAVCRGIVESHGGRIWAESRLGVGSTFYFTLSCEPVLAKETVYE